MQIITNKGIWSVLPLFFITPACMSWIYFSLHLSVLSLLDAFILDDSVRVIFLEHTYGSSHLSQHCGTEAHSACKTTGFPSLPPSYLCTSTPHNMQSAYGYINCTAIICSHVGCGFRKGVRPSFLHFTDVWSSASQPFSVLIILFMQVHTIYNNIASNWNFWLRISPSCAGKQKVTLHWWAQFQG